MATNSSRPLSSRVFLQSINQLDSKALQGPRIVYYHLLSQNIINLTVRFLESGTGGTSTVFLWLASTWVGNQQITIVFHQSLAKLILGALINILGMVSNNRLGNSGSDGINLCGNSTTLDTDTNIKVGELVLTNDQNWLENLQSELLWLDVLNWLPIDLDKTTALLGESASSGSLFPEKKKRGQEVRSLIEWLIEWQWNSKR